MSELHQDIRFCTTPDGVRIAYATMGEGPPLVKAANWLSHLEFDRESPVWRHWLRDLCRHHTYVRYDERGCGLSDWDVEFSHDAWVEDLGIVADAAGLDRFALLGVSQGGAVAIRYAVANPDRVSHLILYGAYARGFRSQDVPPEVLRELELQIEMAGVGWGRDNPAYRQMFSSLFMPEGAHEQWDWFNELQRISTSPENAVKFMNMFGDTDVERYLPEVTVPTLVLHARNDARVPFGSGRHLASSIPGSRFVSLESNNHLILEEELAWPRFVSEIETFLGVDISHDPVPLAHTLRDPQSSSGPGVGVAVDPHEALQNTLGEEYRLEEMIGRGGMATVYLAREHKHDRKVAIKVIHPELTAGSGAARFEREIQITSRLQHPNIVPLIDSGTASGLLYYIAPYIQGASLRDRIKRGDPIPTESALKIAGEVAQALDYAHRHGVVHRDIKPGNIMISEGRAIVTDFGIARAGTDAESGTEITATGAVIGTLAYMSPEQLAGGRNVDGRGDVYALAVVLYEMLVGRPPFSGSAEAIIKQVLTEPPLAPRKIQGELPASVERVLLRALEKEPDRRHDTAAEFAAALETAAGDVTTTSATSGRRRRWLVPAAIMALAALLVVWRGCVG